MTCRGKARHGEPEIHIRTDASPSRDTSNIPRFPPISDYNDSEQDTESYDT